MSDVYDLMVYFVIVISVPTFGRTRKGTYISQNFHK